MEGTASARTLRLVDLACGRDRKARPVAGTKWRSEEGQQRQGPVWQGLR